MAVYFIGGDFKCSKGGLVLTTSGDRPKIQTRGVDERKRLIGYHEDLSIADDNGELSIITGSADDLWLIVALAKNDDEEGPRTRDAYLLTVAKDVESRSLLQDNDALYDVIAVRGRVGDEFCLLNCYYYRPPLIIKVRDGGVEEILLKEPTIGVLQDAFSDMFDFQSGFIERCSSSSAAWPISDVIVAIFSAADGRKGGSVSAKAGLRAL